MSGSFDEKHSNIVKNNRVVAILLAAILGVALVLRLAYLIYQSHMGIPARHPDSFLYDMLARHLLAGRGYIGENYLIAIKGQPTAFYGPIYPLFVAAIYRFIGYSFLYIQLAQIFISVLTVYLVYLTGSRLYGRPAGLASSALMAAYPELVAYPSAVLSETLFVFLEVLFVYLLVRALSQDQPGIRIFVFTGIVFGLAFLCRQVIAAAPLMVLPLALWRYKGQSFRWVVTRLVVFAAATIMVLAPWSIRNYLALGTPSPATTTGGVTFWWGNTLDRQGMDLPTALDKVKKSNPGLSEMEMNSLLYAKGMTQVKEIGPAGLLNLAISKWRKMWMPYLFNSGKATPVVVAQYALIYAILLGGLYGSVALIRRSPGTMAVTAVLVPGILMHLATIGNSRYALPYIPLLAICAVPVWAAMYRKITGKRRLLEAAALQKECF